MKLVFFDTETTGLKPDSEIIQFSAKLWDDDAPMQDCTTWTFCPNCAIETGAMAIHHITPEMVEGCPKISEMQSEIEFLWIDRIAVAHNSAFDLGKLRYHKIAEPKFCICTMKVAKHILPSAEKYSLQFLRYHFEAKGAERAHDAEGDVLVLEKVFFALFELVKESMRGQTIPEGGEGRAVLAKMLELTNRPSLGKVCRFGKKHYGQKMETVPKSYLRWALESPEIELDEDTKFTFTHYLNK